jgi:rhodanese-related sulfurtransferase
MIFNLFAKAGSSPRDGEISFDELKQSVESQSCAIIDVREPNEYAGGHIPGALNLPLSRFSPAQLPEGKPLVLVCLSGARSAAALNQAREAGATEVRHYSGGMKGWRASGGAVAI